VRRILIASSKGGCGKTTLTTNLATAFARQGARVTILDCDPQGSSLEWRASRPDGPITVVRGSESATLWSLQIPPSTDVLLIDTPAGLRGFQANDLLRRCDTLLVPVQPSPIDYKATLGFLETINRLADVRSKRVRVGLLANRVRDRTLASQDLTESLRKLDVPLVASIRDSQAYVMAATLGKGVFDFQAPRIRELHADWVPLFEWLATRPLTAQATAISATPFQHEQQGALPC